MALRVMMTIDHRNGTVSEIWGENKNETSQIALQTRVIQEAKNAVRMHKECSTNNADILKFTLAYVKDAFGASKFEAANTALHSRLLDRNQGWQRAERAERRA
jgi:hypothetical protein